jgi:thiol-disulfide isomerase/thioredoxin
MDALREFIRAHKWLGRLGWAATLVLVYFGVRTWQLAGLAAGAAPELSGARLDGGSFALTRDAGHATLVYFWASWCAVCRTEQGAISDLAADRDVITVALDSGGREDVMRYLAKKDLHWPVLNDPNGRLAQRWGVRATPTFFVVGGDGGIRFREVGYTSAVGLRLRLWFAEHGL